MYEELVKRLREESEIERWLQPHSANETPKLLDNAADAIEKLTQKEKFHAFLWNTIQPNEMELYIAMYRAQAVPQDPPKEE